MSVTELAAELDGCDPDRQVISETDNCILSPVVTVEGGTVILHNEE